MSTKDKLLHYIQSKIDGADHLKKYATEESLAALKKWAAEISDIQLQYREIFNKSEGIVKTCNSCSMCCRSDIGTDGKLSFGDSIYLSMLDQFNPRKYANKAKEKLIKAEAQLRQKCSIDGLPPPDKVDMCAFWSPDKGCNLPRNARPEACTQYVCNVNIPLMQNVELAKLNSRLKELYQNIPLEIDVNKVRTKDHGNKS